MSPYPPRRRGNLSRRSSFVSVSRAYPRAGGGTRSARAVRDERKGLSPRRRGNRHRDRDRGATAGPIPAQAGEPDRRGPHRILIGAYPRAGGGTSPKVEMDVKFPGLSPRRRGNHSDMSPRLCRSGPIPAQAGEPRQPYTSPTNHRAYPRAGGGTGTGGSRSTLAPGLSPRRRGNPRAAAVRAAASGPIPAQAGEPWAPSRKRRSHGAYPRAGGGTVGAQP